MLNREEKAVRLILRHSDFRDPSFGAAKLLSEACFRGHRQIMQLFLETSVIAGRAIGCRPTTLIVPARDGHEPIVRLLLLHSAVVKFHHSARCSALEEVCLNGHNSVVCLLLELPADRVLDFLLYMVCKHKYKGILDALLAVSVEVGLKDRVLADAMSLTYSAGDANAARTLRAHGATCNDVDQSVCAQGCENIVQSVLRQGNDIPKEATRKLFDALSLAS